MKTELMRYRNDSLSYYLNLLGLCFNALFFMLLYSAKNIRANDMYGKFIGFDILFNIVYLLVAFLTAEKSKAYTLNWCWVSLALGVLQIPRLLFPLEFYNAGQLDIGLCITLMSFIVISAVSFVLACVSSYVKSNKLDKYIKETEKVGG